MPAAVALMVLARLAPAEASVPRDGPLGQAHILLATLGVAVFAFAAVLAISTCFRTAASSASSSSALMARGTPLETLDRLAHRCVSIGFPVFTLAIVTGAIWVARLGLLHGPGTLRPEYLFAVGTWVAFAVLLVARVGAGWRGRRAAWLTLGGFGGTALVVGGLLPPPRGVRRWRGATIDLLLVGVSHRTAPVAVRERLAVEPDAVAQALAELTALRGGARGGDDLDLQPRRALRRRRRRRPRGGRAGARCWRGARAVAVGELAEHLYQHRDAAAVRHLFRVASSLDSLVRGRAADPRPDEAGVRCRRPARHRGRRAARPASRGAFRVARRVRRETAIARNPVSVSSVAVDFARQVFGDFARRRVLVVGAGKMSELAARTLRTHGATLTVTNRTRARAEELAAAIRRRRSPTGASCAARWSPPTSSSRRRARSGRC